MAAHQRPVKLTLFLVPLLCLGSAEASASDCKDRFLTEGVRRLRELEKLTFSLQATVYEEGTSAQGKVSYEREFYFQGSWLLDIMKANYDRATIHPSRRSALPAEVVHGLNSRYEFRIYRPKDGPFRVTNLQEADIEPHKVGPYSFDCSRSLSASWVIGYRPLTKWLETDGFSLQECESTTSEGARTLVRLKAKYVTVEGNELTEDMGNSFTVDATLDADDHWRVVAAKYQYTMKGRKGAFDLPVNVTIDYGPRIDDMPVPAVVPEVRDPPRGSGFSGPATYKTSISNVQKTGQLSENRFMVSYFGLPEVTGFGRRASLPWYFWTGALGLLCLAVGAVVRRRSRRADTLAQKAEQRET